MAPRKPKPVANRQARLHVNALAWRLSVAMGRGILVNVLMRGRGGRRVGHVIARRVSAGWKATGDDGETGLEFDLKTDAGVETIALNRVQSIGAAASRTVGLIRTVGR